MAFTPTPSGPRNTVDVLADIKAGFDAAARVGSDRMLSYTRSQVPIRLIHQHIGDLLVDARVPAGWIDLERGIPTMFSAKNQDVVVVPRGRKAPVGESTLSIGVKGAFYGIVKNLGNHKAGVRNDLFEMHEQHPDMVIGQVSVIAISGWDSATAGSDITSYSRISPKALAEFIDWYTKVNLRPRGGSDGFAERAALLLVDFSKPIPVLYDKVEDLERDEFLEAGSGLCLDDLTLPGFVPAVLDTHRSRFTGKHRL